MQHLQTEGRVVVTLPTPHLNVSLALFQVVIMLFKRPLGPTNAIRHLSPTIPLACSSTLLLTPQYMFFWLKPRKPAVSQSKSQPFIHFLWNLGQNPKSSWCSPEALTQPHPTPLSLLPSALLSLRCTAALITSWSTMHLFLSAVVRLPH